MQQQTKTVTVGKLEQQLGIVYWPNTAHNATWVLTASGSAVEQLDACNGTIAIMTQNGARAVPAKYMKDMSMDLEWRAETDACVKWLYTPECLQPEKNAFPFYVGLVQSGSQWTYTRTSKHQFNVDMKKILMLQGCFHVRKFVWILLADAFMKSYADVSERLAKQEYCMELADTVLASFELPTEHKSSTCSALKAPLNNTQAWTYTFSREFYNVPLEDANVELTLDDSELVPILQPGLYTEKEIVSWVCTAVARAMRIVTQSLNFGNVRTGEWRDVIEKIVRHYYPGSKHCEVSGDDCRWYSEQLSRCVFLEIPDDKKNADHAFDDKLQVLLAGRTNAQKEQMSWSMHVVETRKQIEANKWFEKNWIERWMEAMTGKPPIQTPTPMAVIINGSWVCAAQEVNCVGSFKTRLSQLGIEVVTHMRHGRLQDYLNARYVSRETAAELKRLGLRVYYDGNYCSNGQSAQEMLDGSMQGAPADINATFKPGIVSTFVDASTSKNAFDFVPAFAKTEPRMAQDYELFFHKQDVAQHMLAQEKQRYIFQQQEAEEAPLFDFDRDAFGQPLPALVDNWPALTVMDNAPLSIEGSDLSFLMDDTEDGVFKEIWPSSTLD